MGPRRWWLTLQINEKSNEPDLGQKREYVTIGALAAEQ